MDTREVNVKSPIKRLTGQITGQLLANQQYKSFRSKSKDKLINGKIGCTVHKYKNYSKVPRVVRIPSKTTINKGVMRQGKLDDSGDNRAGPSKLQNIQSKKRVTPDKPKPSLIPRRKATFNKENIVKEATTKKEFQFLGDSRNTRNVQRIQLLINQDFRPEERVPANSIASTRPIPTLGQIYERNNVLDTDRLGADWFVVLDTPANSMASNFFNIDSRFANAENGIAATTKCLTTVVTNLEIDETNFQPNAYRTTDENVSDWLSTDIEYPTRDNESGYRSLIPPTNTPMDIKSKHSKCSFVSGQEIKTGNQQLCDSGSIISMQDFHTNSTAETLKEQPTVVLAQIVPASINCITNDYSNPEDKDDEKIPKADHSKNYQYPSRTNGAPALAPPQASQAQVTVPSYVECPSEILQKTTNFEGDDMIPVTCDSPKTLGSMADTDLEFHDDLSSKYTMEGRDDYVMNDHCNLEWCHQCRSCKRDEKSNDSEDTSVADSLLCQYNDDFVDASLMNVSDEQYVHHFRWKRHYEAVSHCKKCQRYRRLPSTRYKLPKTLSSLRRRMSLRICRRRLSRVWKKTAERWAMWSAKSPRKFRKLRMMHYLQRSILWEDADVQTNVFVYRETGTEPTLKEQKSAAVSAILKFGSSFTCNKNISGLCASTTRNNSSKFKHINLGPSMFPFINSIKKSLSKQKFQEKRNSIDKENDIDNLRPNVMRSHELQKMENHVITQTLSCDYSKYDMTRMRQNDVHNDKFGMPVYESDNYIEICEVSMDDKHTGTEDITSPMKDNVTSTVLDLDAMRHTCMDNWESQNAHTQMCIVCNNAETDVKFPPTRDIQAASVLTSMSEDDIFQRPFGTNTDLKTLQSINVMTSKDLLKSSPTFSHIETQVTPLQSLKKISTGILTSNSYLENKSARIDTSTDMTNDIGNNFKDFTNQVMPHRSSFMCSVTKSTSTTLVALKETYAATSRKKFNCAEVSTAEAQFESDACPTSPSKQCRCPQIKSSSRGTETSISKHDATSTNKSKMETYLNTGMLINTLVEGALIHSDKISCSMDTKSIGNNYTSEIATSTSSQLNGTVIERGKDVYPKRLSVETNTHLQHMSRSTEHGAEWGASALSRKKTDNAAQYSFIAHADKVSCRSERIGNSHQISVRTLRHSADETGAQTEPVRIDAESLFVPTQYKCTSVFTSQCALDQPMKPATTLSNDFGDKNNDLLSSPMTSRRRSSSNRNSSCRLNTSAVLSSDLDADKWIKSCIEKGYQSQIDVERSLDENKGTSASESYGSKSPDDKRSDSKSVGSETQSESQRVTHDVTTVASAVTNIMAVEKYDKNPKDSCEKQIVKMVDNVTSDKVVRKEDKEITLEASPAKCETATECSQAVEQKSACVFTSRCILPAPSPCSCQMQNCGSLTGDCLFVYGKPRCVVHSNDERTDAPVQTVFSRNHPDISQLSTQIPSDPIRHQHYLRSVGMLTSYCGMTPSCVKPTDNIITEILTPKVYEALYETTKRISKEESKSQVVKNLCDSYGVDAEVEANLIDQIEMRSTSMLTSPNVRSAAVVTSQCEYRSTIPQSDQFTQPDPISTFPSHCMSGSMAGCNKQHARLLEVPTHDDDPDCIEQCAKTHLVTSCRYYSSLLTKQLGRVRENLTKHLTPSSNYTYQVPNVYTEACTMKPSAREEFGCQTFKNRPCYKGSRFTTTLSPAVSLTDICRYDREHLKSVYYMLTAIEGRMRRFKTNID